MNGPAFMLSPYLVVLWMLWTLCSVQTVGPW